ncbi:unnamed protein product [Cercopithifilaria johnstoni]|uniref:Uncharacterized protein n=1 Tax=Cercopithifilaria johnstoni TaxID=2874296 RepID=A0A8J2QAU3_9BILA|nr:unnamed protein product [Cercopithifilaria johnstoni]
MLPMAMHQNHDRVKRKQKTSTTYRVSRPSLEHMEEGLKPGSHYGSSTFYENVSDIESVAESKLSSCSTIGVPNPKTSRVSTPTRKLSVTIDHTYTNTNHGTKSVDMRPLSSVPPKTKRTSSKRSRCYLILGIVTLAICGIAFTIWLTYDSLEKFVSSINLF